MRINRPINNNELREKIIEFIEKSGKIHFEERVRKDVNYKGSVQASLVSQFMIQAKIKNVFRRIDCRSSKSAPIMSQTIPFNTNKTTSIVKRCVPFATSRKRTGRELTYDYRATEARGENNLWKRRFELRMKQSMA